MHCARAFLLYAIIAAASPLEDSSQKRQPEDPPAGLLYYSHAAFGTPGELELGGATPPYKSTAPT